MVAGTVVVMSLLRGPVGRGRRPGAPRGAGGCSRTAPGRGGGCCRALPGGTPPRCASHDPAAIVGDQAPVRGVRSGAAAPPSRSPASSRMRQRCSLPAAGGGRGGGGGGVGGGAPQTRGVPRPL